MDTEAMLASKKKGQEIIETFFDTTPNVLKMNDMEIYNAAVQSTGYKPVYTEVAMFLLDYISTLRRIYSDKGLLEGYKKLKNTKPEPKEVYAYTVQKENTYV